MSAITSRKLLDQMRNWENDVFFQGAETQPQKRPQNLYHQGRVLKKDPRIDYIKNGQEGRCYWVHSETILVHNKSTQKTVALFKRLVFTPCEE